MNLKTPVKIFVPWSGVLVVAAIAYSIYKKQPIVSVKKS